MRIGIIEIGEPVPLEENVRFHRSLKFAKFLASKGHEVVFWTSNFSHASKKFLTKDDYHQDWNGIKINYIHGTG